MSTCFLSYLDVVFVASYLEYIANKFYYLFKLATEIQTIVYIGHQD
jgi:hypothetical protein